MIGAHRFFPGRGTDRAYGIQSYLVAARGVATDTAVTGGREVSYSSFAADAGIGAEIPVSVGLQIPFGSASSAASAAG